MNHLIAVPPREFIHAFVEPELNAAKLESQLQNVGVRICRGWNAQAMEEAAIADVLVCAVVHLDDLQVCHVLDALRQNNPLAPILLITSYGRGNARELVNLSCDHVLFLDELTEPALASTLESMRTLTCLRSAEALLAENRFGIDEFLSAALARACRIPHPVRSIGQLAHLAGCHRSTLLRKWRASTRRGSRPHFFIDWLLVVHALSLKRRHASNWLAVAQRMSVKEQTIRAAARRTFGSRLTEVQSSTRAHLINALASMLVYTPSNMPQR
jgi:hypothetical protein